MQRDPFDPSVNTLGSPQAKFVFYLPNPPLLRATLSGAAEVVNVPDIIADNGNHWRKILTIMAKLCCGSSQWQTYRDQQLLHTDELLCFDDSLSSDTSGNGCWHIVAGKASWQRLGINLTEFRPLDEQARVLVHRQVILTPYPDYRQLPNTLIASILDYMATNLPTFSSFQGDE